MTFSCGNHDFDTDNCKKLKSKCVMGRPGCVLEGRVTVSDEIMDTLKEMEKATMVRRKKRKVTKKY